MDYVLQYSQIWPYFPRLLNGAVITLQLAFLGFAGGLLLGTIFASIRAFGPRWLALIVGGYVSFFMNTPQLVQIYFIYFALPDVGILLTPFAAVVLGMTLNSGAYLTEIQRAGFESTRRSELEAAEVLGFSQAQRVRFVIVPHIARVLFPPISNQFIIMTLGSSMAALFGVEELTGEAFNINALTFRSIEVFTVTAGIYVAITIIATIALGLLGRFVFRARYGGMQ